MMSGEPMRHAEPPPSKLPPPLHWDLFCRVIDNHGDIGVCWRLAADLGARGHRVRLWTDDASALAWMAPHGQAGVRIGAFDEAARVEPAEVVVETFGCDPPASFVARMVEQSAPPVWVNLEYLSAEAWVERSHGLTSPQLSGVGAGLLKWFFFPGFTDRTGGLLHEPDLPARQRVFDRSAWLESSNAAPRPGERVISLFCYDSAPVPALLKQLARSDQPPSLLLATPGAAAAQIMAVLGAGLQQGAVRALLLLYRNQGDFDHLLWASDVNFVRGEDSFVRAQLAGKPFVWQAYPQPDGAHAVKLDAFAARYLAAAPAPAFATELLRFWQGWNGLTPLLPALPGLAPWRAHAAAWRDLLLRPSGQLQCVTPDSDLTSRLVNFVRQKIHETTLKSRALLENASLGKRSTATTDSDKRNSS